jgi:outer membrane protein
MKKLPFAIALLSVTSIAQADALGGSIGANIWAQEYDVKARDGGEFIDFSSDLKIDDEADYQIFASFEHPIPLIPNIRVQHTKMETDGNGALDSVFYDGEVFDGNVATELTLTHTDATLYYEILDNWIALDLGITGRIFDASIALTSDEGITVDEDYDDVIPMVYVAAQFDLPFTGWKVKASGDWIDYDDYSGVDMRGGIAWESAIGLGAEVGYRYMDFDYDSGSNEVEATVEGVYGGLFWDF